jgi:hypothetical protein
MAGCGAGAICQPLFCDGAEVMPEPGAGLDSSIVISDAELFIGTVGTVVV